MMSLLHAIPFALMHYAALIGFAALNYAVGRKLTANYEYHSTGERAAVCTSLGLVATSFLIFALCLAHWLYPATVLGILAVAAIACGSELRALAKEVTASLRPLGKPGLPLGIAVGGLIFILPYALLGLYPPGEMSFDPLTYHLVVAKLYVQHHGFVFAPNVHFSLFPELTEMLFTLMLMLFDDIAAQLISSLMLAVLIIALYAWGRQLFSRTVGIWASAILLGIPIVIWLGATAYVEMSLTLLVTMAVYSCWNWLHGRAQQWLILAAIFAGSASGTKFIGLFFVALIATVILFYGGRPRRYTPALLFLAVAVAVAAPWYARNLYYTGNPVFPFLTPIFGTGYWTAEDVADNIGDIQHTGVGRSVSAFVSLTWRLAFNPSAFRAYSGIQGPKRFFLLMPLLIPFALADRRIAFPSAVAFAYIVFWFFVGSQDMRYLVPAFPLISLSMAAALNTILELPPIGRRWAHHGVIVGLVCVAAMYSSWRIAVDSLRGFGALPVTQEQREKFFARYWPAYPAVKVLNHLKGQQYTLLPVGAFPMAYFADGTFLGEDFGAARQARIFAEHGDSQGLYRELVSLGADYLLLARDPGRLREDEFFRNHFKLVYARPPADGRTGELYEIARTNEPR